jgi:hypothetical protein
MGRSDKECGSGGFGSALKLQATLVNRVVQGGRVAPLPVLAEGLPGDMRLTRIDRGEFYSGGRHPQIKVPARLHSRGCFPRLSTLRQTQPLRVGKCQTFRWLRYYTTEKAFGTEQPALTKAKENYAIDQKY